MVGPQGQVSFPATTLHSRSFEADEFKKRLRSPGRREYDHAFAVAVSRELGAPNVGGDLLAAFDELDERGQYEVLLYAYWFRDSRFAPQVAATLSRQN